MFLDIQKKSWTIFMTFAVTPRFSPSERRATAERVRHFFRRLTDLSGDVMKKSIGSAKQTWRLCGNM
jgi:hypothetical protein